MLGYSHSLELHIHVLKVTKKYHGAFEQMKVEDEGLDVYFVEANKRRMGLDLPKIVNWLNVKYFI